MSDNYKFFSHKKCEFFPCHKTDSPDEFNCLFCYCPLYALGDQCGGNFKYTKNRIKDCSDCMLPHKKKNYEYIMKMFAKISELAAKNSNGGEYR